MSSPATPQGEAAEVPGLTALAYDLSLRGLGQQESVVNELRARTGTLLAASSLVASFLGGRGIDEGARWLTAAALIAFAVSVAASVYVLLPKDGLIFSVRGTVLFEREFADPGGLAETQRRLAYWLERYADGNQPTIDRMFWGYRVATVAVLLQIVLWSTELAVQ